MDLLSSHPPASFLHVPGFCLIAPPESRLTSSAFLATLTPILAKWRSAYLRLLSLTILGHDLAPPAVWTKSPSLEIIQAHMPKAHRIPKVCTAII